MCIRDRLFVLFNTPAGRDFLKARGLSDELLEHLTHMGFSSICNMLGAIATAKKLGLGADDAIVTIATDGGAMYASELEGKILPRDFDGKFDAVDAATVYARHLNDVCLLYTSRCV